MFRTNGNFIFEKIIMRVLVVCFFVSIVCRTYGQHELSVIPESGKVLSDFIPSGWEELISRKADLNLDSLQDMIVVLNKKGEDSLSSSDHPVKRIFLILTGQKDKTYRRDVQNQNVVYHYNYDLNFKDALTDIRVARGLFYIDHYGGFAERWGRTSTFKYNSKAKNWFLTEDEYSTFQSTDPDNTQKERILTQKNFGKVPVTKFDIYKKL
jgi:hypothetical protein